MAGLPRKRHFEEVDRLDLLTKPLPNASLHGAVTSLSEVKEGRNYSYFDGTCMMATIKSILLDSSLLNRRSLVDSAQIRTLLLLKVVRQSRVVREMMKWASY